MDNIKDTRNWQVSITDPAMTVDGVDDLAQCIYLILSTIPGSDPLRPEFGSNVYQYLDRPLGEVKANIIYAAINAIERWEKRIEITRCTVSHAEGTRVTIKTEGKMIGSSDQVTITTNL